MNLVIYEEKLTNHHNLHSHYRQRENRNRCQNGTNNRQNHRNRNHYRWRLFFEITQRIGAKDLRSVNFKALFESMKKEQAKLGKLQVRKAI